MRILIAPDKFKGCLPASEVGKNIAAGLGVMLPGAEIEIVPIADGGDGTAEVICEALGGAWVNSLACDPFGRQIDCRYAYIEKQKLAVMEMSEVSGMRRLKETERDPLRATTFGVGQLILNATRHQARKIIVGLGGSATNDGGFGMARALGYRFFAEEDLQLRNAVGKLAMLQRIEKPKNCALPDIIAAVDVRNPLLGKTGATRVFGPQKGAGEKEMNILENALKRLAVVAAKEFGSDYREHPGAGAAGGLGFGLMTFAGAVVRPGFEVVSEAIGLESRIRKADVVITGEGKLDLQTLEGKAPAGVAGIARKLGKRVFAIVGSATGGKDIGEMFDGIYPLETAQVNQHQSLTRTGELLQERARELAESL